MPLHSQGESSSLVQSSRSEAVVQEAVMKCGGSADERLKICRVFPPGRGTLYLCRM